MKNVMSTKSKYVVFWQDHVTCVVVECSSNKERAVLVKKVTDFKNIERASILDIDEFIKYLRILRRSKEENWKDFSPTPNQVLTANVDTYFNLIMDSITEKVDSIEILPSI